MMKRFFHWLADRISPPEAPARPDLRQTGAHRRKTGSHVKPRRARAAAPAAAMPRPDPEFVDLEPHVEGRIEDNGPGKNVLIRNKFVREDTGTHDTLKILDDSMIDTEEETGMDPYNTGQFDRSRSWDKRSRN